jgi:4-amino-4-deoxy-L-arabinose transferase-like glycosyltransferase
MKNSTKQLWEAEPVAAMQKSDWTALAVVLAVAIALRILFFTGYFGSDEVTYVETALNIVAGDWRASNYIGATRYGMNLPVALSVHLFGLTEASANLWPFLCSVGEVAIVFVLARWLWSTRVAIISAGLLALLPLHVHLAGRIMADPPLAFFISLSVALLLRTTHTRHPLTYVAAGLAWGGVFWVKESVGLLYVPVFLLLNVYINRFNGLWFWLFVGMGTAMAANSVLMYFVSGNPLHVFAVMNNALATLDNMTTLATSPLYYLRYLFVDIRHTLFLGYLFAAGVVLYVSRVVRDKQTADGTQFVILWALLLIVMFSFAVVSFSPVKLVMKQTNYMMIFCAPLVLLAGWFLASLTRQVLVPLGALVVAGSVILSALEQQAINVFTTNSRAGYVYLRDNPRTFLLGTINTVQAVNYFSMMESRSELREQIMSFGEMLVVPAGNPPDMGAAKSVGKDVVAVLDLQTIDWGNKPGAIRRLSDVPGCWIPMGTLTPSTLGSGRLVVQGLLAAGIFLPESFRQRYISILKPVLWPLPAYLFLVEHSCLPKPI